MTSPVSREAARRLRPTGAFHWPPPAQPVGSVIELIVEDAPSQPQAVITDTRRDITWRVYLSQQGSVWKASVMMPIEATIIRYHFEFEDQTALYELRQNEGHNTPIFGQWQQSRYQIAVYLPSGMPPDWTQGMVIYQIFPDRFANGDTSTDRLANGPYGHRPLFKQWGDKPEHPPLGRDFFGGDLRGAIEKLDYLADLGVDCVYFTPIFAAPTNHRYDALDYMQIDPMLGSEDDFNELVAKAHQRNIRIILDAVYNHCSVDSRYFGATGAYPEVGAVQSKESPYFRWFEFTDWPNDWNGWIGLKFMPEFAECPEVEEFFTGKDGPTAKWTNLSVDGWRTDVTSRNSDIFWRRWRYRLDRLCPDNYTVAEEWENASHYLLGDMFSAAMNYRLTWALYGFIAYDKLTPSELDDRLQTWLRDTPGPAIKAQMNLIDSHDTLRALTACMDDKQRFFQMVAFQFAYPGAPMIYYGDEAGLQGDYAENGRRTIPWDNIPADFHDYYSKLIAYRRTSQALRLGEVETVIIDDQTKLYAFVRHLGDDVVYCAFNGSDEVASVTIPLLSESSEEWHDALGAQQSATASGSQLTVSLEARGAAWYTRR